mgnify:CR=1 FL=1
MINSISNKAQTEKTAANVQPKTNLSMMARATKHVEEQDLTKLFKDKNDEDHYFKLEIAMKYLDKIDSTKGVPFYFERSEEIMQHLQYEFQKNGNDELYLPWVRYLDISARKKEEYPGKKEGSQGFLFKQGMDDMIIKVLSPNQSSMIDWRITKKILSVPNILPEEKSQLFNVIQKDTIFKAVQSEIDKSRAQMIWLGSNSLLQTAKNALEKLSECCRDESCRADLMEAFISGRIDKVKFGLSHSLILGEDGGFYLLLNRLTKDQQEDMITGNIVTRTFLQDKISKQKPKDERAEQAEKKKQDLYGEKVIIGKGGFGAVKFAVSLFNHKGTSPGDVICIKKSRNFTILSSNGGMMYSSLQQATEATIEDYFASSIAEKVYAPQIFDLAIVSSQSAYEGETDHRKGYLMMEMLPQNNAIKIFDDPKYQKWKYQKPYLIEVLSSTLALLKESIAFTDLKPHNTLYDTNTLKTTVIDLGSTIKVDTAVEKFEKSKYSFQTTPEYRAPELGDSENDVIDLGKALAFTCGQLMKDVVLKSDYQNRKEMQTLVEKLTYKEPDQRISIQEALDNLERMGDDSYKEDVVFRHYIAKIEERIENNRSSVSLNEDILQTKQLHIDQNITSLDPEKYKDLNTEDLFRKIDTFLLPDQKKHQVMVVFGSAGSGKSIALQLKFIEAVRNWQTSQPLPIYFNMANGIELRTIIDSMNQVLGTHITFQDLRKKGVHLYIDSFDEGLGLDDGRRETLIQEYVKELAPTNAAQVKFIISCRTDYLVRESNYKWFTPRANEFDKLLTVYIAPIDYKGLSNLKEMISIYAKHNSKDNAFVEKTQKKIEALHLHEMITTGFMFYVILEVVSQLKEEESKEKTRHSISKQEIFRKYVSLYQEKELKRFNEEQKSQLRKITEFIEKTKDQEETKNSGDSLITTLRELGKYIAVQLHLQEGFRLDQTAPLFPALAYDSTIYFKRQTLAFLLKSLPLKIETKYFSRSKKNNQSQEVKIGFLHDTLKNSYLLEAIQEEIRRTNGNSKILSNKSIVADSELVRFIADAAKHNLVLKQHLRQAIDSTKTDKSERAAIYAANSITILVAAHYSFTCQDLSNINIRGANIQNGIFSGADFSGADFSYANLGNIQADDVKLVKPNLKAAKFGVLPDLKHPPNVKSVSVSHDGKYIASGSKTMKIWELETSKCLATIKGHNTSVLSMCFSPDGRYIASSSHTSKIKIWEVSSFKCITTLEGHHGLVLSVSFSPQGKHIASGSIDKTVKIWEVETFKCVRTFEGHQSAVMSVAFSPDEKYIASGSQDKTVKIWEVETSKCLTTLEAHNYWVKSVVFSPNGKYFASAGLEDTKMKIWEIETSKCIAAIEADRESVTSVSFSPNGKYLASSGSQDKTVKLWDAQTFKCLVTFQGHTEEVSSLSFSGDGKYIVSVGSTDQTVKIWEVQTSKCLSLLYGHNSVVKSAVFSHDGRYITSASWDEKKVKIWDLQTSKCLETLGGPVGDLRAMSYSKDGKRIASAEKKEKIAKIWDAQTSKLLATLEGHKLPVMSVSFSDDGRYIASGSEDRTVKIWEVETAKCCATLQGHGNTVWNLNFSFNGKFIASGSADKTVKIWEVQTSTCIATLQGHTGATMSASFSADGKYIASCSLDSTVKIWEVGSSQCLATFEDHKGSVLSVSFSQNGNFVASGSEDSTVKIWEVHASKNEFKCAATLKGHTGAVEHVSFSDDGKYLASSSTDKTVRIWVSINGTWYCDKIFSAFESPLSALHAKVDQVILSKRNKKILKQLVNKGEMNENESAEEDKENEGEDEKTDETEGEMERNPTVARETAIEFSEKFLKTKIIRDEEPAKQKVLSEPGFQTNPQDIIKEKEKSKASLKPGIGPNNQVARGDVNPKNADCKKHSSCCTMF